MKPIAHTRNVISHILIMQIRSIDTGPIRRGGIYSGGEDETIDREFSTHGAMRQTGCYSGGEDDTIDRETFSHSDHANKFIRHGHTEEVMRRGRGYDGEEGDDMHCEHVLTSDVKFSTDKKTRIATTTMGHKAPE